MDNMGQLGWKYYYLAKIWRTIAETLRPNVEMYQLWRNTAVKKRKKPASGGLRTKKDGEKALQPTAATASIFRRKMGKEHARIRTGDGGFAIRCLSRLATAPWIPATLPTTQNITP